MKVPFRTIGDLNELLSRLELGTAGFEYSMKISAKTHPRRLYVYLRTMQYVLEYVQLDFLACFTELMADRGAHGEKIPSKKSAGLTLRAGICTDVISAAQLVALGFDVQAKNILRACREKLDLLWAVSGNEDLAADFIGSQDLDDSKKFFFRKLSKGKLRKAANVSFQKMSGSSDFCLEDYWDSWRDDYDTLLAAAEHPNHSAGMFAFLPKLGQSRGAGFGLTGLPSNVSITTLNIMLFYAFELMLCSNLSLSPKLDEYLTKAYVDEGQRLYERKQKLEQFVLVSCLVVQKDNG